MIQRIRAGLHTGAVGESRQVEPDVLLPVQALPEPDAILIQEIPPVKLPPRHRQEPVGDERLRILIPAEAVPLELFDLLPGKDAGGFGVAVAHGDRRTVIEVFETVIDDLAFLVEGLREDLKGVLIQNVILIDKADPLALRQIQAAVAGIADAAVLFIMEGDDAGIAFSQPVHQPAGIVGGGIVADQDLDRQRRLFFRVQDRRQRPFQPG